MRVESYSFGRIKIEGKEYTSDVIVGNDFVKSGWWRKEGHRVQMDDIAEISSAEPEVVIFGTGANGRVSVDDDVIEFFKRKGCEVIVTKTHEAVRIFNELVGKRRVVLAAHLTC
ncbi:MAG: MTH938/NDUFAF3 family protein [Archaeoglobaceae archaeon]